MKGTLWPYLVNYWINLVVHLDCRDLPRTGQYSDDLHFARSNASYMLLYPFMSGINLNRHEGELQREVCVVTCAHPAGWRSCSCALMSTVVWVPPAWPAPPCACFISPTTASRTGPKSASLAPCSPAWTLWSWLTTTWPLFRTARISCSVSSPTYAASTCTTQVSGASVVMSFCQEDMFILPLWSNLRWNNSSFSVLQFFLLHW